MKRLTLRRIVTLSMLLALSVGLHYLETLIPNIVPIPGFRLGLSNVISLFVLYYFDGFAFAFIQLAKVLLVALISTGFSVTFFMSLTGTLLSMIISLILYYLLKPSIYGVSFTSSLFHVVGQLLAYAIFFSTYYIFEYLLILGPLAIVSGILIALIDSILLKHIPTSFKEEETKYRQ